MKGFTGTRELGTHLEVANIPEELQPLAPPPTASEPPVHSDTPVDLDGEEELEDEQAGEDEDMIVLGAYYSVLDMSSDGPMRDNEN